MTPFPYISQVYLLPEYYQSYSEYSNNSYTLIPQPTCNTKSSSPFCCLVGNPFMRCPMSRSALMNSCSATYRGTCQQQHWLRSSCSLVECSLLLRTAAEDGVVSDIDLVISLDDAAFCKCRLFVCALSRTPPDSRCCGHLPNARPILKFSCPMLSVDWLCVTVCEKDESWKEARSVMVPIIASDLERLCDFLVGVPWCCCVSSFGLFFIFLIDRRKNYKLKFDNGDLRFEDK